MQLLARCASHPGQQRVLGIVVLHNAWRTFQTSFLNTSLPISIPQAEAAIDALALLFQHDGTLFVLGSMDTDWLADCCSCTYLPPDVKHARLPVRLMFVCRVLPLATAWYVRHLEQNTSVRVRHLLP
jgi:hypothetical protein